MIFAAALVGGIAVSTIAGLFISPWVVSYEFPLGLERFFSFPFWGAMPGAIIGFILGLSCVLGPRKKLSHLFALAIGLGILVGISFAMFFKVSLVIFVIPSVLVATLTGLFVEVAERLHGRRHS